MSTDLGRVAVGLAGGAAKGLGHIGVLEALAEHGIEPEVIAGTSAGAMVGGLYAAGFSAKELRDIVTNLDSTAFRKLIDLTWAKGSLVAGDRVEKFLRNLVGDVMVEDLPKTFVATAVDINSGLGYYLNKGSLVDAIRASISIPGIFEPVAANGGYLVDGGLRRNLPLEILRDYSPDTVVAVNIRDGASLDLAWRTAPINRIDVKKPEERQDLWQRLREYFARDDDREGDESGSNTDLPGVAFLASQAFNIITADLARLEIETTQPDLVLELDMSTIELWEFWRGVEAADLGYEQCIGPVKDFMNRGKRWWKVTDWFS